MSTIPESRQAPTPARVAWNYIDVLKPRETALLTFIALCAAVIAAEGSPDGWPLAGVFVAVFLGSAGANGLTNYLDRHVDVLMARTCGRAIPSQRIDPPERMLPLAIGLVVVALAVAGLLHPLCLAFGLAGTIASLVWRKRSTCIVQGTIAGCAPVLIGYLAISHKLNWTILALCVLIAIWIPLHVWSVMVARRDEYFKANIAYFPLTMKPDRAIRLLLGLSVLLYAASLVVWQVADLGWFYFAVAHVLGIAMAAAGFRLVRKQASRDSWRLYKLSSFPYLGLIFMAMCIHYWL